MPHTSLAVLPDEQGWSAAEAKEVRAELLRDLERLGTELKLSSEGLRDMLRDIVDGSGNDQADLGSTSLERDAEMSLAANQRELLIQSERALQRLEDGTYGICESCGEPIGKMRLMAFPRATLCMECKKREERR
jgi:DnaK suppressor protein